MNPTLKNLRHYGLAGRTHGAIAPNTFVSEFHGEIAVTYHSTVIYTEDADSFSICFNGWTTRTTYDRLNAILPAGYRVQQRAFQSQLVSPDGSVSDLDHYGRNRIAKEVN